MRLLALAAGTAIVLLAAPSLASTSTDNMKACSAKWTAKSPADKKATKHADFMSSCLKGGGGMMMMMMAGPPAGSTAECKDGTYTTQKSHQGACSGHKGVMKWL